MYGTCNTKPEGPPNAISLLGALEVVTEVIVSSTFIPYLEQDLFWQLSCIHVKLHPISIYWQDDLLSDSFPVTDGNVKNAVGEMCPLIQYNYEVKNLINSEPDVSVATQAMDVLLDSIVTESCDWVRVVQ